MTIFCHWYNKEISVMDQNNLVFFILKRLYSTRNSMTYKSIVWQNVSDFFLEIYFENVIFNSNWHEVGYFYLLVLFGLDFVSLILAKTFQTFGR